MAPEITDNITKIIDLCKKMEVQRLYVFGLGARSQDYNPDSDLDFLFSMFADSEGLPKGDYFDLWFGLEEITGRKVDLVKEKSIRNKFFLKSIMEDRAKIYEA